MQYCASASRRAAMGECHVQHAIIWIRTLNLRISCTRHYPIEPLINLNLSLIHMVKITIDKHTTSRNIQAHNSQVNRESNSQPKEHLYK